MAMLNNQMVIPGKLLAKPRFPMDSAELPEAGAGVVLFANKYARATQNMQNASRTWSGFYWDSTGVYLEQGVINGYANVLYCMRISRSPHYLYDVIIYSVLSGI